MQSANTKFPALLKNLLVIAIGSMIGCVAQAQTSEPNKQHVSTFNDKKESHHHKHQLPPETPIPHRLETTPTQPHPQIDQQQAQRAAALPQK